MNIQETEGKIKELKKEAFLLERENPPQARKMYFEIEELQAELAKYRRKQLQFSEN